MAFMAIGRMIKSLVMSGSSVGILIMELMYENLGGVSFTCSCCSKKVKYFLSPLGALGSVALCFIIAKVCCRFHLENHLVRCFLSGSLVSGRSSCCRRSFCP